MRRKTTRRRGTHRHSVLEARVMSPRIAWFAALRFFASLGKVCLILALIGAVGWGIWLGVRRAFYQNPDFSLRLIEVNDNQVINDLGVINAAGIQVTPVPNLFDIDTAEVEAKLNALPEIESAIVERHLPGTLAVHINARNPRAWIASEGTPLTSVRRSGAMLVDDDHICYPCPPMQVDSAASLPAIFLPAKLVETLRPGDEIHDPSVKHCFQLLDSIKRRDPAALNWVESVRAQNEWSILLTTRQGTRATFSLGDHERQIETLRLALDHAAEKGATISTINLIPRHNIPFTTAEPLPSDSAARTTGAATPSQQQGDLRNILNRN